MFERYTEKARRVIFFARYEASQFGSTTIETEHLVLGILREDKALTNRFLRSHASVESIRREVEANTVIREKVATSVDLPLSNESKRVLAYAAEEAERMGHKHIGTEHLLLGLLREEGFFGAQVLKERGLNLAAVREELANMTQTAEAQAVPRPASPAEFSRDLTQAATDGELDRVLGRGRELDAVIEVLAGFRNGNPLLVGERGCGKTAIVEALAQKISEGETPPFLADKRVLVFDSQLGLGPAAGRQVTWEQLRGAVKTVVESSDAILFAGDLRSLLMPASIFGPGSVAGTLRQSQLEGKVRCIATSTPADYQECLRKAPWIGGIFRVVHVRPLSEEETLAVLELRKPRYEKFHHVSYTAEALQLAAQSSGRYLPERALPGKALELLDAAGARVQLCQTALPAEIAEVQNRIKFIVRRMDTAIQNHEFEKARFYSTEERKERENLHGLRDKFHLEEKPGTVSREDIEETVARWAEYPFQP